MTAVEVAFWASAGLIVYTHAGYPLLLASVISTLGEDLRGLVFVQAMLGLGTVAGTYWLGRLTFGRVAGAIAALSVAIGGQLLLYEHYVLAESVFAMFLTLAMLALVAALRRPTASMALAATGGALLAAASLLRPIAEVVVPLLPIYFLASVRPARRCAGLQRTLSAQPGQVSPRRALGLRGQRNRRCGERQPPPEADVGFIQRAQALAESALRG